MFFFWGEGSNGKTTFTNTMMRILGDYAQGAALELLTETKNEQHPTNIARLMGARLVVSSEPKIGQHWDETKLKKLTSNEPLTGRFMHCNEFDFWPQFKLIVHGNNKPSLRKVDLAIRRRMNLIPFTATIPEEEQIKDFHTVVLEPEYPGILQWMVNGCLMYQQMGGLCPPEVVRAATEEYLSAEDSLGSWLSEHCLTGPQARRTRSSELYADYAAWAERNRERVMSNKTFSMELKQRGYEKVEAHGMWWVGIQLRKEQTEEG